jgi:hypothetical protein
MHDSTETTDQTRGVAVLDIWTFQAEPARSGVDQTGFSVEAIDGKIGKVDEATYEAGGSYLVVDTGPWIFGKKVVLPAGVVGRVDPDAGTVSVQRTRDEIKSAPEYDERRGHRDEEYRRKVGTYYGDRAGD